MEAELLAPNREHVMQRTGALLSELAALWGVVDGDVIVNLFDVPKEDAERLGVQFRGYGAATVEVGPHRDGPYRTVNVLVRG